MELRIKYCEDHVLFGMEKNQRNVVFGLPVLEGLSRDEGSRWSLKGAQAAELGPMDKEKLPTRLAKWCLERE